MGRLTVFSSIRPECLKRLVSQELNVWIPNSPEIDKVNLLLSLLLSNY